MFDTYWAPTEIAQDALGYEVVSAVAIRPHARTGTRGEILALSLIFVAVILVALSFPWFSPLGPPLASALTGVFLVALYQARRSWAWHVLQGDRRIRGTVAVFFADRVEVHDETSIRAGEPLESYPIERVRYSGFSEWANPRLLVGSTTWSTNRRYGPYIAAALPERQHR